MAAVVPEPASCKWVVVGSGSLPDALPSVSALAIAERDGIGHSLLHLSPGSAPMVLAASASACAASAPVATACAFSTSQLPKVVRTWCVLHIFTWKCASRHNGVHFFDIATAKSGPHLVCFVHFHLEMCFAPQRRALFHLSSGQLAPHPPL